MSPFPLDNERDRILGLLGEIQYYLTENKRELSFKEGLALVDLQCYIKREYERKRQRKKAKEC